MDQLYFFYISSCPYCRQAQEWLSELQEENEDYKKIPIRKIEENQETALARNYDYFYVPCFFTGKDKLHEGAATKEKIKCVLDTYLNKCKG
jgi:glutaredoxin